LVLAAEVTVELTKVASRKLTLHAHPR